MKWLQRKTRLITVTRSDLSSGYQTVQTGHAIADFALKKPFHFLKWRWTGNYLITLAVEDNHKLQAFMGELDKQGVKYVAFYEQDVQEVTAIALVPGKKADRATANLPLANKTFGVKDKHTKSPTELEESLMFI